MSSKSWESRLEHDSNCGVDSVCWKGQRIGSKETRVLDHVHIHVLGLVRAVRTVITVVHATLDLAPLWGPAFQDPYPNWRYDRGGLRYFDDRFAYLPEDEFYKSYRTRRGRSPDWRSTHRGKSDDTRLVPQSKRNKSGSVPHPPVQPVAESPVVIA